jgi:hypothetical protein
VDSVTSIDCLAWAVSPGFVALECMLLIAVVLFVTRDPGEMLRMVGTCGGPKDCARRGPFDGAMVETPCR